MWGLEPQIILLPTGKCQEQYGDIFLGQFWKFAGSRPCNSWLHAF